MKILFTDLDGTLLEDNKGISPLNLQKLQEFQNAGHRVALCTGRNIFECKNVIENEHFPFDYLVLNNGGHILDAKMQTIFELTIPVDEGKQILDYTTKKKGLWSYFCDGLVTYGYLDGQCIDHANNNQPVSKDFISLYQQAKKFQIIAINQENEKLEITDECVKYIKEHFSDHCECHYNTFYLDIVPSGCSKGEGIKKLLTLLDDDFDKVYAIGDSYNDLSMIQEADVGCTFDYANEDIQKHSDCVVHYEYEFIDDILRGKR